MKHFLIQFLPAGVEVSSRQLASFAGFLIKQNLIKQNLINLIKENQY